MNTAYWNINTGTPKVRYIYIRHRRVTKVRQMGNNFYNVCTLALHDGNGHWDVLIHGMHNACPKLHAHSSLLLTDRHTALQSFW